MATTATSIDRTISPKVLINLIREVHLHTTKAGAINDGISERPCAFSSRRRPRLARLARARPLICSLMPDRTIISGNVRNWRCCAKPSIARTMQG